MKVLVDTCIWSMALRRKNQKNQSVTQELVNLIDDVRIQLIGPIRQEILSGIKITRQFNKLRRYLSSFPDLVMETADYEEAAEFFNTCKKEGIQGSITDFLICAVSINHVLSIYTVDKDFEEYQKKLPIKLHKIVV